MPILRIAKLLYVFANLNGNINRTLDRVFLMQVIYSMSQGLGVLFELTRSLRGLALWDDSYLREEARLLQP